MQRSQGVLRQDVLGQVFHILKGLFIGKDLLVFHGGDVTDFAGGGQRSLELRNPRFVDRDRVLVRKVGIDPYALHKQAQDGITRKEDQEEPSRLYAIFFSKISHF